MADIEARRQRVGVREGSRLELQLRLPGDWPSSVSGHGSAAPAGDDLESVLTWLQEVEA